jgi:hypothetical protein
MHCAPRHCALIEQFSCSNGGIKPRLHFANLENNYELPTLQLRTRVRGLWGTSFPLPRHNPCLIQTFVGCGSVFSADAIIRSQRSQSFCVLAEAAVDRARTLFNSGNSGVATALAQSFLRSSAE